EIAIDRPGQLGPRRSLKRTRGTRGRAMTADEPSANGRPATAATEARLRAALEELEASERRFRSLVQNVSDMILVVDGEGRLQYASPSLERILGWAPSEKDLGLNGERIHPDDIRRLRSAFVH